MTRSPSHLNATGTPTALLTESFTERRLDMSPETVDSDPAPFDTYISDGVRLRLWDGTRLDSIRTPRHDLRQRARPFVQQCNFHYAAAVRESARWLRETVDPSPEVYRRLLREDVAGFVSWTYPDATPGQIRALSDFHNWSVWLDDKMDRRSTRDISLAACSVLEGIGSEERAGDIALGPFEDFFGRMRALGMSDRCAERFVQAMRRYGAASRVEVRAREGDLGFRSVKDYIGNRRASAAMPVYCALIEWVSRVDLPDKILRHPVVERLENCCSDYSLLYNDAGSFVKEHLAGRGEDTFVRLLSESAGLSVQDTLFEIADMAAAAVDDLEATGDLIEQCDLPMRWREQVHRYAAGLRTFVGGVNYWSNHTCRYLIGQPLADTPPTSRAGDVYKLRSNEELSQCSRTV